MRNHAKSNETLRHAVGGSAAALALALGGPAPVAADEEKDAAAKQADWEKMQERVISADELLSADVSTGLTTIGDVSDLVLSRDGSEIQYVLYEIPFPYQRLGEDRGFTTFEGVSLAQDAADVTATFEDDVSRQAPEQLELTAAEADHRLVSRILGNQMYFTDDESRRITDMLVDRDTGTVTHYVVAMDDESLFDLDRRAIPADVVSVDQGGTVSAETDAGRVQEIDQSYDEDFL